MDWNSYYNMMSMNSWNYPMMSYSMIGYQNPYQNWNMPLWNYQMPYYYNGAQTSNPSFTGRENTAPAEEKQKTPAKTEPKEYVNIHKDGSLSKSTAYIGKPETIEAYKKEYKRKQKNRDIASWATFLGAMALGAIAGPKVFKLIESKYGTMFASNTDRRIYSAIYSAIPGALGVAGIQAGGSWKKDLKEKYQLEKLDLTA